MSNKPKFPFDFEFYNETNLPDAEYYEIAYEQINEVAEGYDDIIGASISLEELSNAETPHSFQARVVIYVRPDHIAATEVLPSAMEALQSALDNAIRQVNKKREILNNH